MRPIDADALLQRWNDVVPRMVRDKDGGIPIDFLVVIHEVSVTPTLALDEVKPQWISVEERLPEYGQVIAFSPQYKEYMIGYLDESSVEGIFCRCDGCELYQVTHWMPLPEPPGEEENNE